MNQFHNSPQSAQCSKPYWQTTPLQEFPELNANLHTEVCIVGAGIAGLTTAYLALKAGLRVVVLESDHTIAGGESSRTTAHLTNAFDDRFFEIERMHGMDAARIIAESHTAAIDRIEVIVKDENIDCDFLRVDGYLIAGSEYQNDACTLDPELQRELDAARSAGIPGVERVPSAPNMIESGSCLLFPRQAQFHPIKYLSGLAQAILRLGGEIYIRSHVSTVKDGKPVIVKTARGNTITTTAAVMATNIPMIDRVVMHTKQAPYRSYVVGLQIAAGAVPPALYWDTQDPYHYVRVAPYSSHSDLLIVGGEDHKTGQADDSEQRFAHIEQWARTRFSQAGPCVERWSGQVLEPADGLAFIGKNPGDDNVYIVTGDSGNGMTHGTVAGILLTGLITAKTHPWASVYDPKRKPPIAALGEYGQENINVASQYLQWITEGDVAEVQNIRPNSGAIVRHGLHKIAVFRDEDGTLQACNATCPHLGCLVNWNSLENSWDCPCHGSRFTALGQLICGPALHNLERVEIESLTAAPIAGK